MLHPLVLDFARACLNGGIVTMLSHHWLDDVFAAASVGEQQVVGGRSVRSVAADKFAAGLLASAGFRKAVADARAAYEQSQLIQSLVGQASPEQAAREVFLRELASPSP